MLEKDYALKISAILASPYYRGWVSYFEKVLRATRSKRHKDNKDMLLAIQYKSAQTETQLWNSLREGRERAKELHTKTYLSPKEEKELRGLESHILIHEQLIRISRTICDGIAWRNLDYNRMFLDSSSRGFGAGSVDVNSREFKSEFIWAHRISKTLNSLVLLNDLTRFLRIGDLTEIGDGVPFIHEIKKYGKDIKNVFTLEKVRDDAKSDQAKRLLELQRIAFSSKVAIHGGEVGTRKVDLDLRTNINKVKRLIRDSEEKLIVSENVDDCIQVEVTNFKAIQESRKPVDVERLKGLSPIEKTTDLVLTHSNWDTFYSDEKGNFLRLAPPYSIYPFSAKDCLNLMSGFYLVKCTLNITKLKEILRKNNWEIEERTEEDLDKQIAEFEKDKDNMFTVKQGLYAHTPDDRGLFTIRRGPFSTPLYAALYSRLTMEYISLSSFLDILESMYRIASQKQRSDAYFLRSRNENELWN